MILPYIYDVDISQPLLPTVLQPMMVTGDKLANRIGVRLKNGAQPYTPDGSCRGYVLRADGATVPILNGVVNGNEMYIDLPEAAYAVQGSVVISIVCVTGTSITTVFLGSGTVNRSQTDVVIDPGTVIDDISTLIQEIETAVASIPEDYSTLSGMVDALTHVDLSISGKYIASTGVETANSDYSCTDYIPVNSDSVLILDGFWTGTGAYAYTFYDSSKAKISGANSITSRTVVDTIPSGAAYVRFSSRTSQGETPVAYVSNHVVEEMLTLSGRVDAAQELAANAMQGIASVFAPTAAYSAGDYVWYLGVLYRFTTDHVAGAWTGTDAEEVKIGAEVADLKSAIGLVYNGEVQTSDFIQGKYANGVWAESTSRCTIRKPFNVESGTIFSVDGNFENIKYGVAVVHDDGTIYDSGWRNYNSSVIVQKRGKAYINFAKENGTDAITPSDITASVKVTTPINNNYTGLLEMMNFWHTPIAFSPKGSYKNAVSGVRFIYENGFFMMSGKATLSGTIRLTKEFDIGVGSDYIATFADGIHLKPNTKYRIISKLYNGARIANGQRYGVTVSVYSIGGVNNIGTFTFDDTTLTNDFVAPNTGIVNICFYINNGSEYTDCRGFVVLEEAEESIALKEYYESEADDTISKVRQINNEPALVFPCVTDIHRYKASVQTFEDMINNMKHIAKNVRCDFVLNTGDTIEGDQQQDTSLGQAYDCISAFTSIGEPFFYVEGNHDNNPYISSGALVFDLKQVYGGFFTSTKNVIFNVNENGTDYYFDFPVLGVRFISINSCNPTIAVNYGFGTTTAEWLEQALNTEHTIILASHVSPIKEHVWNNINPGNADAVRSVLSGFVNGGGKLIIITGHSHIDAEFVNPYIEVTNVCQKFEKADITSSGYTVMSGMIDGLRNPDRTANTYTADAWTVCVYKPVSNELDMLRFGAGVDRYIHCTPVSSGALTTRFDSATWSTSDSSVATVANGVVTVVRSGRCAIVAKDSTGNIEVWVAES